jgi:hypothetical protein
MNELLLQYKTNHIRPTDLVEQYLLSIRKEEIKNREEKITISPYQSPVKLPERVDSPRRQQNRINKNETEYIRTEKIKKKRFEKRFHKKVLARLLVKSSNNNAHNRRSFSPGIQRWPNCLQRPQASGKVALSPERPFTSIDKSMRIQNYANIRQINGVDMSDLYDAMIAAERGQRNNEYDLDNTVSDLSLSDFSSKSKYAHDWSRNYTLDKFEAEVKKLVQ